jgi:adenylate kinase
MDRGDLVPDAVILGIMKEALAQPEHAKGVILDGVVRTVPQAEGLARATARLGAGGCRARCSTSRMTNSSRASPAAPPATPARSPSWGCSRGSRARNGGGTLVRRKDDEPEAIRNRLRVYPRRPPVLDWYVAQGANVVRIDAVGSFDEVTARAESLGPSARAVIQLKSPREIETMAAGGRILAATHRAHQAGDPPRDLHAGDRRDGRELHPLARRVLALVQGALRISRARPASPSTRRSCTASRRPSGSSRTATSSRSTSACTTAASTPTRRGPTRWGRSFGGDAAPDGGDRGVALGRHRADVCWGTTSATSARRWRTWCGRRGSAWCATSWAWRGRGDARGSAGAEPREAEARGAW